MTRKKVNLAYIANDSARKATFKKRKKGLMKKVRELSTLCGIDACAIIYSPYESQPEVWPSPIGVQQVLAKFKRMPEMEQSKKMVNQESFLRQRITKSNEQLKKQRKENREKEVTQVMFQSLTGKSLHNLNMMDLNDLGWMIDQTLKEINRRTETLKNGNGINETNQVIGAASNGVHHAEVVGQEYLKEEVKVQQQGQDGFDQLNNLDNMQRQQWFMDLVNPQEPFIGFGGEEMILPFGDNNHNINAMWSSNAFFP